MVWRIFNGETSLGTWRMGNCQRVLMKTVKPIHATSVAFSFSFQNELAVERKENYAKKNKL